LFVEKTHWTIGQISELTVHQINSLIKVWAKLKEDKPSTKEDIEMFKRNFKK
jgi:hypothetical protein